MHTKAASQVNRFGLRHPRGLGDGERSTNLGLPMYRDLKYLFVLGLTLPFFWGCSERSTSTASWEVRNSRFIVQRDVVDQWLITQMTLQESKLSKQRYSAERRTTLFDFLIGESALTYPRFLEAADAVDERYIEKYVLQKENVREWIKEVGITKEYFAFATDVWDFRYEGGVQFLDTLIVAVEDGKIIDYRMFAECPY